jgi:hypothetical protein
MGFGRLVLSSFFALLLLASFASTGVLSQKPITVSTDKLSYGAGEVVYVYGVVWQVISGERVNITVLNPLGRVWVRTYVTPDVRGNFGAVVGSVSEMDLTGTYRVRASYAGYVAETSFQVRIRPNITIRSDKYVYLTDEAISVSGKVSPYLPDYPITIYLTHNESVKAVAQVTPQPDGSFRCDSIYRVGAEDRGRWAIVANYGNLVNSSLDIFVGLYVNVDVVQRFLKPGDLFKLASKVSFVVSGPVKVRVTSPSGGLWGEFDAEVGPDGSYGVEQQIYPYDEPGVYSVTVSYWGASNTTTFRVGRLGVGTFEVSDAGTFDAIGNPTSTFLRGQTVQVSASLRNTDIIPHKYVYVVQIRDSSARVVFIGWIDSAIAVGQTVRHSVGTVITTRGNYTASIMVWDDWSTPTPLTDTVTLTFKVV